MVVYTLVYASLCTMVVYTPGVCLPMYHGGIHPWVYASLLYIPGYIPAPRCSLADAAAVPHMPSSRA